MVSVLDLALMLPTQYLAPTGGGGIDGVSCATGSAPPAAFCAPGLMPPSPDCTSGCQPNGACTLGIVPLWSR